MGNLVKEPASANFQPVNRIPWVDYAKGLSMSYIVLSHVVGGLPAAAVRDTQWYQVFHHWVGGFVIALFFFVSGLFISSGLKKPFITFLTDRARTGLHPYVVWVLLFAATQTAMSAYTRSSPAEGAVLHMLWDPPWHYWFMYALVIFSVLHVGLRKLGMSSGQILILTIVLHFSEEWLKFFPWRGLHFVCGRMPFYAFGAWVGRDFIVKTWNPMPTRKVAGLLVAAVALVIIGTELGLKEHQATMLMMIPIALTVMVCIATLLERYRALPFIETCGRRAIHIYLAHVFATAGMRIFLDRALHVENGVVHLILGTAAGIVLPIALVVLTERLNFPYLYSWPRPVPKNEAPVVAK